MVTKSLMQEANHKLYARAYWLSMFTIFYNIIEGGVSILFGYRDETLSLFGFGMDSLIEVLSAVGVAIMIKKILNNKEESQSLFEINALKTTGVSFYLLSAGLLAGIIVNLVKEHKPETTLWGVIISLASIAVMSWLMVAKRKTGKKIDSEPVIADANCTKICIYMSVVLLFSSLVYEFTGFAYADSIGAAGLIYFSVSEGREAFEKAKGKACSC
jgi:divalent metal cation (Fe/Co/Zn/Cd) transporter